MDIWIAPDGDAGRATQFKSVSSNMDGLDNVRWTPDGKIVFHSMAGGRDGIWIMDADGKNRKQLTTAETGDYDPSVTTDGRYVVFTSERTGAPVSWVMNVDGSNQKNWRSQDSIRRPATVGWSTSIRKRCGRRRSPAASLCDSLKNVCYGAASHMTERWSHARWRRPARPSGWPFCLSMAVRPSRSSTLSFNSRRASVGRPTVGRSLISGVRMVWPTSGVNRLTEANRRG
jgi:hypothetical protein